MSEYRSSSKRLAKNTIALYMRQIIILIVSLYTSRVVLASLGVEDYGIYNIVGGFVSMFGIVSGAFSMAISRYMSYILGEGDNEKLSEIFSTANTIMIALGILLSLLIVGAGLWYVPNKMVLPPERISVAIAVLITSVMAFFLNIISTPYNSLIIAYERMKAFAYIGIFEAFLKLAVALLTQYTPFDHLFTFGILTLLSGGFVRLQYVTYCNKNFEVSKNKTKFNCTMMKKMMSFVGWAFLGNGSTVIKSQGVNLVLNLFGGPVVNAARGLTTSVESAVTSFMNNYLSALQPQITKLYSTDQKKIMNALLCQGCRISFFLMYIICVPLIKNLDFVLSVWLVEIPKYTYEFIVCTLITVIIQSITYPLVYGIMADGKIKYYEIVLAVLNCSQMPVAYGLLKVGFSPIAVYIFAAIIAGTINFVLLYFSYKLYDFSITHFCKENFLRMVCVSFFPVVFSVLFSVSFGNQLIDFLLESFLIVCIGLVSIYVLGIDKDEKKQLHTELCNYYKKLKNRV